MSKHLKTRVDWPALREWCLAHGAKNEFITFIQIDGHNEFNVILESNEVDAGKPFLTNLHEVATWRTTQPLRFFP